MVDLTTRELWKSGVRIKLGGQPFEILVTLLEQPGRTRYPRPVAKRIWSEDTFVDFSHGLNAAVNKLREALSDSADNPSYIETLPAAVIALLPKSKFRKAYPSELHLHLPRSKIRSGRVPCWTTNGKVPRP